MHFIIYETKNCKTGKRYRGRHTTENLDDGYLGFGTIFKKSIKKHGPENFERTILFHAFDYNSLLWAEKVFVDEEWVARKDTYNITIGGRWVLYKVHRRAMDKRYANRSSEAEEKRDRKREVSRWTTWSISKE